MEQQEREKIRKEIVQVLKRVFDGTLELPKKNKTEFIHQEINRQRAAIGHNTKTLWFEDFFRELSVIHNRICEIYSYANVLDKEEYSEEE